MTEFDFDQLVVTVFDYAQDRWLHVWPQDTRASVETLRYYHAQITQDRDRIHETNAPIAESVRVHSTQMSPENRSCCPMYHME